MEKDKICVKLWPLNPTAPRRCGVCEELLVIPPIYSCNSVPFICGPCFEGYQYYLDDDELRAADKPIRQILYENFASNFLFHCSYYPHCSGLMAFDQEAKEHYKNLCIAKVFWIFKCPITAHNRWFLLPKEKYCKWKFARTSLISKEIEKLVAHVRLMHSEYILERPYVLNLKDLQHKQPRQLFLLLLEENGIIAVFMAEITKNEVIFRCRVSDPEWLTQTRDPYECVISLIPPHDRFRSIIDIKFDCVPLHSNGTEYPWNSVRFPIRHLIAETSFQITVFPRSVMLQALPYLHRYRKIDSIVEEDDKSSSEATLSNPESIRTDYEILSYPSSISDDQMTNSGYSHQEPWNIEETEIRLSSKNVKKSEQTTVQDTTGCEKLITRRSTDSVFCNMPRNEVNEEAKTEETKLPADLNLFFNYTTDPESIRTDYEILSYPSSISDDQITNSGYSHQEPWNIEETEIRFSSKNVKKSEQTTVQDTTGCEKLITRRSTDSVFCNRPRNEVNEEAKTEETKLPADVNLFVNYTTDYSKSTSSRDNISNLPSASEESGFSNPENPPQNVDKITQIMEDVFENANDDFRRNVFPRFYETMPFGIPSAKDLDCFSSSSENSDDTPLNFRIPSPTETKNEDNDDIETKIPNENLTVCDYQYIAKVFDDRNNECQENNFPSFYENFVALDNTDAENVEFLPLSPSNLDFPLIECEIISSEAMENEVNDYNEEISGDLKQFTIYNGSDDTGKECDVNEIITLFSENLTLKNTPAAEEQRTEDNPSEIVVNKTSSNTELFRSIGIRELKHSSSETNPSNCSMPSKDLEDMSILSLNSDDAPKEFRTTSSKEWNTEDYNELNKRSPFEYEKEYETTNKVNLHEEEHDYYKRTSKIESTNVQNKYERSPKVETGSKYSYTTDIFGDPTVLNTGKNDNKTNNSKKEIIEKDQCEGLDDFNKPNKILFEPIGERFIEDLKERNSSKEKKKQEQIIKNDQCVDLGDYNKRKNKIRSEPVEERFIFIEDLEERKYSKEGADSTGL